MGIGLISTVLQRLFQRASRRKFGSLAFLRWHLEQASGVAIGRCANFISITLRRFGMGKKFWIGLLFLTINPSLATAYDEVAVNGGGGEKVM